MVDEDDEDGETVKVCICSRSHIARGSETDVKQTIHKKSEMLFVRGTQYITSSAVNDYDQNIREISSFSSANARLRR